MNATDSNTFAPVQDESGLSLPERVANHPLLDETAWIALRDSGREPSDRTAMATTRQTRAEFLTGAWLIDKIVPPHLGGSLLDNLQPQMLVEADVLNAGRFQNAVLEPRRSAKTTSLWCVLLGRSFHRPVYMTGYTMLTTAKKTTERYRLDVLHPIQRQWPDKSNRPVKVIDSNGFERVEFPNGSVLAILSPDGDAVRSGAYDTLVLDEGGEAEPDKWDDVVAAVLPSFDTRGDDAQLVIAGTGGRYRNGSHFWSLLHDDEAGRLRYGVADEVEFEQLQTWEQVEPIIARLHPGLDGLTTLAKIRANFFGLGPARFAAEYLGFFGTEGGTPSAVSAANWAKSLRPGGVPEGVTPVALAFAVHPGGLWASIGVTWLLDADPTDLAAAAWALEGTDETPRQVGFKLLHHQEGNARMVNALYRVWQQVGLPIIHDDSPQEKAIVKELLGRVKGRKPKVTLMRYGDKAVAHTRTMNALEQVQLVHWEQQPLDAAASAAVLRESGKSRLFGIPSSDPGADITAIETMAAAFHYTTEPPQEAIGAIVVD